MHHEDSSESGIELKLRELIARCDEQLQQEALRAVIPHPHTTGNTKLTDRPLYAQMPSMRGRWLRPAPRTPMRLALAELVD